jgi:hypothetical protein
MGIRNRIAEASDRRSSQAFAGTSRPYGDSGRQAGYFPNSSRRQMPGQDRRIIDGDPPHPLRNPSRAYATNLNRAQHAEEDDPLPPLKDREIIDVTDEDDPVPARSNSRSDISGGWPQDRYQRFNRAASPPSQRQQNPPLARMSPSARLGDRNSDFNTRTQQSDRLGDRTSDFNTRTQDPRTTREPIRRSTMPNHPPPRQQSVNDRPTSRSQSNFARNEGERGLYLGIFDLEETNQEDLFQGPSRRGSFNQRSGKNRSTSFNQRSSAFGHRNTASHRTSATNERFGVDSGRLATSYRPLHPPSSLSASGYRIDSYHAPDCPWRGGLPWNPRSQTVHARQTIFAEISIDYFEHETPIPLSLDLRRALEVIRRYNTGWKDAYNDALEEENLTAAERTRIERNLDRLASRREDSIQRLQDGDHQAVVQETLDQVRMDRQMAVDMPVSQVRWAPPWIKEVWIGEHGDIPPP